MEAQIKKCTTCKADFTIEPDDFDFYTKIKVVAPTLCPPCRQQRRYAWRNERTLYRRNCDLCNKSMVTIYSPDKPYKVYCQPCWWGDGWDPTSYGKDFDFTRPFFEQFSELQKETPRMALLSKNSVNSEYCNHSGDNKNVYLSFSSFGNENVYYSTWVMKSRECMDSSFIYEAGERLYNCIDSRKSYCCQFGFLLQDCVNCNYCYDLRGCSDCFLSSNLRNKSYFFKNVQYSREEYLAKVAEYNLSSYVAREKAYSEYLDLLKKQSIHRYVISERNIQSTGNLLFDCKNVTDSFEINKGEDSKYCYGAIESKTCMDLYHVGYNLELNYECQGCTRISNCQFCHLCYDNMGVMYSDTCQNSQNLFGCVSIKKGEYIIFNKKYTKEEYLALKEKIIEHMKKTEEYGEFFPPSIAPVYYNETQGQYYEPLTKEEVLKRGWHWEEKIPGTFSKETISWDQVPDTIGDVTDGILKEILKCIECSKNFNITADELTFYRREQIPVPHACPECRYKKRFAIRLPRKLWKSRCMCSKTGHGHEGDCPNNFETSYAPERPEVVYCEQCYQQEVS